DKCPPFFRAQPRDEVFHRRSPCCLGAHHQVVTLAVEAFSRIGQQRLELAPVSLEPVIKSILSRLEQDIQEKGGRVDVSGPWPRVLAHQPVLEQVLTNLVSNGLKFARPGTPPVVTLRAEETQDFIRLWVEDNGIGIRPEHQDQIFRLFNRLHGDKYPGTGVGLAIVQKGIARMGGNVGLESTPGQGSRFWIDLRKVPAH
ncbi:MAG TPA: ATP-binding protein, partial [Verrucomicrobiae bacterium]